MQNLSALTFAGPTFGITPTGPGRYPARVNTKRFCHEHS